MHDCYKGPRLPILEVSLTTDFTDIAYNVVSANILTMLYSD